MLLIKILFRATFDHAFPCHTDGAGIQKPYDLVIMQCIRPANIGGETTLVHINDIVEAIKIVT